MVRYSQLLVNTCDLMKCVSVVNVMPVEINGEQKCRREVIRYAVQILTTTVPRAYDVVVLPLIERPLIPWGSKPL